MQDEYPAKSSSLLSLPFLEAVPMPGWLTLISRFHKWQREAVPAPGVVDPDTRFHEWQRETVPVPGVVEQYYGYKRCDGL